jgi:hypothetical protein
LNTQQPVKKTQPFVGGKSLAQRELLEGWPVTKRIFAKQASQAWRSLRA